MTRLIVERGGTELVFTFPLRYFRFSFLFVPLLFIIWLLLLHTHGTTVKGRSTQVYIPGFFALQMMKVDDTLMKALRIHVGFSSIS